MSLGDLRAAYRRSRVLFRTLARFRRNARLSRTAFVAERLQRFRAHLAFAGEASPYYAQVLRDARIDVAQATPSDLPVLTKAQLRDRFDDLVTDRRLTRAGIEQFLAGSEDARELYLGTYRVLNTSGSAGPSAYVVFSDDDWVRGMAQWLRPAFRPPPAHRLRPYRIAFYGTIRGHYGGVSMASPMSEGLVRHLVQSRLVDVDAPLPDAIGELNAFQPDFLVGYVAALKVLADAQLAGDLAIRPKGVHGGGETMTDADAAHLRRAFQCEVRNGYGCTEHLMMGLSGAESNRMVLYDDDFVFEIEPERVLVTNLYNRTLPLFRYMLNDVLRPVPDPDPAFPHLAIETLIGRSERTLVLRTDDGREEAVLPYSIIALAAPGMHSLQLRIDGNAALTLLVRVYPGADAAATTGQLAAELRKLLDAKRMRGVSVSAMTVPELPLDARTGKHKLIVDARPGR